MLPPQPLALLEGLFGTLQEAKLASQTEVRQNAHTIESLVRKHQEKQLDDAELLSEIDARRLAMRQLLRERHVKVGGRMERLTLGLLEVVKDRIVAKITGCASAFLMMAQDLSAIVI